ncbi:tRNA lysidine(34) synthetase TilS [Bordetella genomosp. 9]|uniref:tRNA(Ile)-lysidine synthase n=1 Tax=Bordetella genomosp. 9 TaxID=1416803 RepID=A0A1W6Z3P8_9BORD|nr:tRNA lysidine(34) synthetase TilS [Bordetella genomosp. 9]ARP87453.1 tRNA lysidine(34) synthetase TilS [Bordetella genomosp. 9]
MAAASDPDAFLPPGRDALTSPLRRALAALPDDVRAVAAAVSGGADSAMLAVHAAAAARERGVALHLLHVHHGLFEQADDWAQRVRKLGDALGAPVHVLRVTVPADGGVGIEAAARQARYAAFAQAAQALALRHILLAHHRDDQAETVLLRLLRGAGPAGLAAMSARTERDGLVYLRPWLDVPRAVVRAAAADYAARHGWSPVDDPSNADDRYTRAAVRKRLVPVLDARWPGWQGILARHARLAEETASILDEVARQDLASLDPSAQDGSFSLARWRQLSAPRQAQVLRCWLAQQGARMPTEARLAELLRQLRQLHSLGHDRQLAWNHGGHCVRVVRGRVFATPR